MKLRTVSVLAAAASLAIGAAGCADTTHTLTGDSAAIYLDLNHLKYQVQVSREMNSHDPEDINYLVGLPPSERGLAPNQQLFGVWIAVFNRTKQSHLAAGQFTVTDTQGNVYHPLALGEVNQFAYRQRNVERNDQIPRQGSLAFYGPIAGALLVFKLSDASFQNRPLTLRITDPTDPSVVAQEPLDV